MKIIRDPHEVTARKQHTCPKDSKGMVAMSMSDERIEVAERLRSKFLRELGVTAGALAFALCYTAPKGVVGDAAINDLWNHFADLVDPTCHAVPVKPGSQIMVCDTCGNIIDDWIANYCASCGSRIMSYDDGVSSDER